MYVCMYVYNLSQTQYHLTSICACLCVYAYMYIYIYHVYKVQKQYAAFVIYIYIYAHTYIHTYTDINTYTVRIIHAYIHTYIHTGYINVHMHTYTYMHTHMQAYRFWSLWSTCNGQQRRSFGEAGSCLRQVVTRIRMHVYTHTYMCIKYLHIDDNPTCSDMNDIYIYIYMYICIYV